MTAQVPLGGVRTLYARTGDLFAWCCVAALVLTIGACVLQGRVSSSLANRPVPAHADIPR